MSPIAATIPAATARFTPVIVISLLTAGSLIASCAISRSSRARSSASRSSSRTCRSMAARSSSGKKLSGQPRPAAGVEKIGMRALRDQVRVQDRMHLILEPRAMPHDLVAPRHQPALAFGLRVRRPDLRQVPSRMQTGERAGIDLVGLYVSLGDRLHLQWIGD